MISVIYPTFNEEKNDFFHQNLMIFKKLESDFKQLTTRSSKSENRKNFEFIFVDGGSKDSTQEICKQKGYEVLDSPGSNRAFRLKIGRRKAKGKMILLHHPRTILDQSSWQDLIKQLSNNNKTWGGFHHQFDEQGFHYNFTSWYSNHVRFKLKEIVYLDHCIFFHNSLMKSSDMPEQPIFEDTLISYHLRKKSPPSLLNGRAITSSVRFKKNGFYKQVYKNQKAKINFFLNKSFKSIDHNYEKGLHLNQDITNLPQKKFDNPRLTAKGEQRASVELKNLKTLWFNTGSLCNLECENCYIESGPRNDQLQFLEVSELVRYLEETKKLQSPLELIGFTGGEPFINPFIIDLITETLKRGFSLLILTNAFKVTKRHHENLLKLKSIYGDKLKLRVSLDHYTKEFHEKERGSDTFDKTMEEIKWLFDNNFCLSLAGRTLTNETSLMAREGYLRLLKDYQIDWNLTPDKLALFPEMDLTKEVPEITTACWDILQKCPQDQMCASERMIVHNKGKTMAEVMPCTLLAYDKQFILGTNLENSQRHVYLNHPFCAQFCVLGGASCSAQK